MKLLGWMHRKFRQNSGDPFRDFTSGNPCNCLSGRPSLEEHHHQYPNSKQFKVPLRPIKDQWFLSEEEVGADSGDPDDEVFDPPAFTELFHNGLLTIGTLGSPGLVEPDQPGAATPTFGVPPPSVDAIAEKEEYLEATEIDLMVINSELENLLVIPEPDKGDRLSSARASQVSAKNLVVSGCPLQEYLLGVPVEMAETTTEQQRKEHHRTSLGDLFMKSSVAEEGGGKKEERERMVDQKPAAGVQMIVKKMLKRRGPGGSSRASSSEASACNLLPGACGGHGSATSENKFHKIMQMFHRKVHPENSVAAKKAIKSNKSMNKLRDGFGGAAAAGDTAGPARAVRMDGMTNLRCHSIPPAATTSSIENGGSDSNGNRAHWIKTDADYVVLEL